jgi:uncharacterized protein YndB with AHSA1/START domain
MTENRFTIEKIYAAPVALVWKAITDRALMKEWYFSFGEDFQLTPGAVFEWEAGSPDGKQWLHRGRMLEIVSEQTLVYTWEYPGYTGSSTLYWYLSQVDENTTRLTLIHDFTVPFDPAVAALQKENFVTGWNHIIHISLTGFLQNKTKQ